MQPQWQQQQQYPYNQSFQQPQQTGAYGNPSFLNSQPTGFQQPMQTGFNPQAQQQRPQQTGFANNAGGGNYAFLNQPPPSSFRSGLAPQVTGFPGGGASGLLPQQTGFAGGLSSQPTGFQGGLNAQPTGYGGLTSQPTGFGGGRLQPQATGLPHDPRLQQMMQSFMPSNLSQPFAPSGVPQFNPQPAQPLAQTFQTLLQNPTVNTPKVPWTLTRQEKKDYDQIFRAWDRSGDGFISGDMAREVFGQSGLGQDDLMKIWNLSDVDNRGKLNLPEFHVAMGLIYRALNGNQIPDTLPEELVPASMRDIDTTVNFMKDLLRHEASSRSNTSSPSYGGTPVPTGNSKDALLYKHSDERPSTYKPSSRHLDRKSVRYAGEDPDAGLQDIRRKLQNTSTLLEKSAEKSAEDEELEEEIESLQYRVKRIQEDIEYTSKGRRTAEKDEERRKLERELLYLMHEKLPELERRQERRKEEKAMEDRAGVRRRDDRNKTHGRYDDRDDYDRDRYRGTFDRERSRDRYDDRDRYDRRDSRDRDHDRYDRDRRGSYERPRSPPASREPPPAPPPAAVAAASAAPPPPPAPQAAAPSTKNMTPEERKAFIREQAQRRINERLRALGVESAQAEETAVDTSVQDRLELEKKEAEEKSQKAEAEQAARDEARRKRLAEAGGAAEEEKPKAPAPPSPSPALKSAMKKPAAPPPAPHSRAKAPPPPQSRAAPPSAPPTPSKPAVPEEDPEERELRQKEEAAAKVRAERRARLEAMMKEEEEDRKQEEALLAARQNRSKAPSPIPPSATTSAPESAPPPPPPPPAPPADTSYNPFRKPSNAAGATPSLAAPATTGGFNPFFKPPAAASPAAASPAAEAPPPPPAPPAPPAPPPVAQPTRSATRSPPVEPEWEDITEKQADSDDSSDDEYTSSRAGRQGLAQALFGNILPSIARPGTASPAPPAALPAPKAPSAALANLGGGNATESRGALLSAIQGGARLKKATTVDKSGPPSAGKVVGDAAPPEHINSQPRAISPVPQAEDESFSRNPNRQSVDWYAGLAADASHPAASAADSALETTKEEEEDYSTPPEANTGTTTPAINVEESANDELDDFDMTTTLRVRSLYAFEGTRDVDLSFKEDVVIAAHPAKDTSSAWWYGMLVKEGSKGWFPKDYVEEMHVTNAKALYSYTGTSDDQLPFAEGDLLPIVDRSDADWWKTEKAGVIFLVPASYLELQDSNASSPEDTITPASQADVPPPAASERGADVGALKPNTDLVLTPSRPRATSLLSVSSSIRSPRSPSLITDEEGSSSEDSVLSFWSSDSDSEEDDELVDVEKEMEKKRREEERQKILSSAGLQLKKEPPGVPSRPRLTGRVASRRKAPGVPGKKKERRSAPAIPTDKRNSAIENEEGGDMPLPSPPPLETQDAYARYEAFLANSQSQQNQAGTPRRTTTSRPASQMMSPTASQAQLQLHPQASASSTSLSLTPSSAGAGGAGARLSGFFSRMMAPTPSHGHGHGHGGENRKSISGPITRVDSEPIFDAEGTGGGGRSDEGFGKTWGSLVDQEVLETMSTKERKRQEAIFEFIATESTYNRDLQLIVEVFYAPLLSVLDDKALTVIFANIEDILLFNTSFLSSLEERQKACRLYVDRVGDVLSEHLRNAGVYMTYCVNQHQAIKLLQSLRETNPELDAHLKNIRETNSAVRGLDLSSYLLIPMQRITRYPLLLKQIIAYSENFDNSPEMNDDLALVQVALSEVEEIVGRINESVREAEGEERLRVLSEDLWIGGEGRLDLAAPTSHLGPRRLLKEGKVTKSKSGRKLYMVLCNDIIVLMDGRDLYRMPMALHELEIRKGKDENSFLLKIDRKRGGDSIGLKVTNAREAKEWVGAVGRARARAIDARDGVGEGGRG